MIRTSLRSCLVAFPRACRSVLIQQRRTVFGIQDLVEPSEKPEIKIEQVQTEQHQMAIDMIKRYYLPEHVLVRARSMDLNEDCAIDEYLTSLIKQGNSVYAKSEDGQMAGVCVAFASSPVDVTNLRSYAFYRQVCNRGDFKAGTYDNIEYTKIVTKDPNTRDFLFFTAKLQETPNLWETFKQSKIFEIKMLTVAPEYRKQGLATALVECAKSQANDQGYNVVRMDCINPYDYKVAERCMFRCIVKFPLHRLRGTNAPFVKRSSPHNCCVRVYVDTKTGLDSPDFKSVKQRQRELESLIE